VDSKNPPTWYDEGGDIGQLLDDADCLNWLNDTGDLGEDFVPTAEMAFAGDPTAVTTGGPSAQESTGAAPIDVIEPAPVNVKLEGGVHEDVHPSAESLSFLVDSPSNAAIQDVSTTAPHSSTEDVASMMPSFSPPDKDDGGVPMAIPYTSATQAVAAHTHDGGPDDEDKLNTMGFPDLDMGDEQAFVSALLENSGQSTISFPKLNSDLGVSMLGDEDAAS
jgi:hypothetical protein